MADDEVVDAPEIAEGASEDTAASGGGPSDPEPWSKEVQAEYTKKTQALAAVNRRNISSRETLASKRCWISCRKCRISTAPPLRN